MNGNFRSTCRPPTASVIQQKLTYLTSRQAIPVFPRRNAMQCQRRANARVSEDSSSSRLHSMPPALRHSAAADAQDNDGRASSFTECRSVTADRFSRSPCCLDMGIFIKLSNGPVRRSYRRWCDWSARNSTQTALAVVGHLKRSGLQMAQASASGGHRTRHQEVGLLLCPAMMLLPA